MVAALRRLSLRVAPAPAPPSFSLATRQNLGLQVLAWAGVAAVLWPLAPGLLAVLRPALDVGVWQALFSDVQFPAALGATVFSALGSTVLALLLAALCTTVLYPSAAWQRLQRYLPAALALPHAAFAIGLLFLLAPSGWLARGLAAMLGWTLPPQWVTVQDPYGLSLTLALALKESCFLLWMLHSLLSEQVTARQLTIAYSLGYNRWQVWWQVLWPQLLPRLGWPLLAVFAYGLSVVDMALLLGPSTPPTLAVLGWQWFREPQALAQGKASAVALILLLLLVLAVLLWQGLLAALRRWQQQPQGVRRPTLTTQRGEGLAVALLLPGALVVLLLGLWSVAGAWFFPAVWPQQWTLSAWTAANYTPLLTTLGLGAASVVLALPVVLLWLEWGGRQQAWLYLPLLLPALPLAAAQYQVLLPLRLDGSWWAVVWAHLAWVLPYMILVLAGAYRAQDPRYVLTAQALGLSAWQACIRVKWPLLLRPILAAMAVGFAVSVAQYVPTLFAGGGRFETVTTEAVALSAGGNRRVTAVQALLQALLPLCAFVLAGGLGRYYAQRRQGVA